MNPIAEKVRLGLPLPLHWDLVLRAATPLTRLSMAVRLRQRPVSVDAHVVSFGNITTGGTGKTPAVIERVQAELARGKRVAVVTRGYGSARVTEPFVVQDSMSQEEVARLVGDEPALIRHHAPDCVIVKAARRAEGARLAVRAYGCEVVVLDDAFQHVQLARDENYCLIDATNPFGNGHLLPRGILREPLSALTRATEIIITRCDQAEDLPGVREALSAWAPDLPVRETIHAVGKIRNLRSGETMEPSALEGEPVTALSAIGNPEAFHRTLESLGAHVASMVSFPDHAFIPEDGLKHTGMIITTEKDAMRIVEPPENLFALEIVLKDWKDK